MLRDGVREFEGTKLTQDNNAAARYVDVNLVTLVDKPVILTDEAGVIGSGGNSGFQAINVAAQFGAAKIILVGFDYRIDLGVHWHGKHPRGLNNPSQVAVAKWRARLDEQAARFEQLGITVLNVSPDSALAAYPKVSLEEALEL